MIGQFPIGSTAVGGSGSTLRRFEAQSGKIVSKGIRTNVALSALSGRSVAKGVSAESYNFVTAQPGKSVARGVKVGLAIEVSVGKSISKGVEPTPTYRVEGVPDITVSRNGNTVTVSISNRQERSVLIQKATNWKGAYSDVGTFTSFPVDVDVTGDPNPRLRAAFVFTGGEIGGQPSDSKGQRTLPKTTRNDG